MSKLTVRSLIAVGLLLAATAYLCFWPVALMFDTPQAGLFPVRCHLILKDLPAPFVGGPPFAEAVRNGRKRTRTSIELLPLIRENIRSWTMTSRTTLPPAAS